MKKKKINLTGVLMIIVAVILLTYTALDAFKIRPELKNKVETVTTSFSDLKVYLDKKLPEIDSVLVIHTNQIEEQHLQLKELNTLTTVLKEN